MSAKEEYFQLPEDQCERFKRSEFISMNWLLAAVNSVSYGWDDLAKRLECIPNGKRRYRLMLGQLRAICNDLIGTMPEAQKAKVRNTMHDNELRLVPKMTPRNVSVVMSKKNAMQLVDFAKVSKCAYCTDDAEECRKCVLYQIMSAETPLEEYGGMLCPYNLAGWEE